jgi:cytochrome P450 family 710 subfamily A protein
MSYNSILGKFMVFSTDVEVSRKMLSVNDPGSLLMAVHPSAKNILGPNNLAFMHGPPHKAIRKSFLALFTRKALGTYVELQDGIIRRHIAEWLRVPGEREIRPLIRCAAPLNAEMQ